MKKTVSLIVSGLIASSSMAFGANSIDSAFKEGKASGSLALYGEKVDKKGGALDSGFGNANATVAYETADFKGFNAKAEFKGNLGLGELERNDRSGGVDSAFANNSLMTEAYLKYAMEGLSLTAGRQAIDLEWLGDYNEAVVAAVTAVPDTTIVLGYTQRQAESGFDLSEDFADVNGNKGAYVVDAKYTGLKSLEFNPYAYSAPDLANWYGLKTTFTADMFGVVAHYALSNEDVVDVENGSIGHVELNTKVAEVSAAVGYIKTDKDGGDGSMSELGDNISPLEDGNQVYEADAKTVYGSLGYSIASIDLGALYGETTYGVDNEKEKELNLTVGHSFTESLAAEILFADIKAESSNNDYNKVLASVEYTF